MFWYKKLLWRCHYFSTIRKRRLKRKKKLLRLVTFIKYCIDFWSKLKWFNHQAAFSFQSQSKSSATGDSFLKIWSCCLLLPNINICSWLWFGMHHHIANIFCKNIMPFSIHNLAVHKTAHFAVQYSSFALIYTISNIEYFLYIWI